MITVAIPTYCREEVLIATIESLLLQDPPADEILVLDQTPQHKPETKEALRRWNDQKKIRWILLDRPSITGSMNRALRESSNHVVLFIDDDIIPGTSFVAAHVTNYENPEVWAVAGQVLQPEQTPTFSVPRYATEGFEAYLDFPFYSSEQAWIENGMAGNLSVRKNKAISVGGFDENFIGVSYRFETEFCRRLCRGGGKIRFEPKASIRHLRVPSGGTRTYGNHLCSGSPAHGVGDYYFALREGVSSGTVRYMTLRPIREVFTRYHLKHPWCIPVKLTGEVRAFIQAMKLASQGPLLKYT